MKEDIKSFLKKHTKKYEHPKKNIWKRRCLRCDKEFSALTKQTKICPNCKMSYGDYKNFEFEVYEFLKKKYKKVTWLSEKRVTPYDFSCIDEEGKEIFGDAKFVPGTNKPRLKPSQHNADFIVYNNKDELVFVPREEFYKHVAFDHNGLIKIHSETKNHLDELKNHQTYDMFIQELIDFYQKNKK